MQVLVLNLSVLCPGPVLGSDAVKLQQSEFWSGSVQKLRRRRFIEEAELFHIEVSPGLEQTEPGLALCWFCLGFNEVESIFLLV